MIAMSRVRDPIGPQAVKPLDTAQLGPIRIDASADLVRRARAQRLLDRHSPADVIAASDAERRSWVINAMLAFADEERRR